jgi:hypothetical protein
VHRSVDGGDYTAKYNIINNFYKPGPLTPKDEAISYRILKPEAGRSKLDTMVYGRAYVRGNVVENNSKITKDNWAGGVQIEGKNGELLDFKGAKPYFDYMNASKPFPMPWFRNIMTANDAYDFVIANAGATLPMRDVVDTRIARTVKTGVPEYVKGLDPDSFYHFKHRRLPKDSYKQGIITDIAQVGGYPEYKGTPYKDSDKDGIPDAWEKINGLNPNDASDAKGDQNNDGYTNIEDYINGINPKAKVDWKDLKNNKETLTSPLLK